MAITRDMIKRYQHPRIKIIAGVAEIYEGDIKAFSFRAGTGSGAFAPGGCVIASCNFTVINPDGRYSGLFVDGAEVQVYVGYGRTASTATYDLLCTVYAYGSTIRMSSIAVKCYDGLRKADKTKWTTYTFPTTANQIIESAAAEAGITIGSLPANGGDIPVDLRDDDGQQPELSMTCRQAIAAALLISGNYGRMTADGRLQCGWYTDQADVSVETSWLLDYTVTDSQAYTGVQVYGQEITGSDSRLYKLSSGQFVTEANCAAIQARLYEALVGLPVCEATVKMILDPNIPAGVMLDVTYPQAGSSVTARIPITSVSVHGGMSATYSCDAITADEADDLRAPEQGTVEDVANGDYATKDYVDEAIKNSQGGGGSGGDSAMTIIYVPLRTISYGDNTVGLVVKESGVELVTETSKANTVAEQYVAVPTYKALGYTGNEFTVVLRVSVANKYFGSVAFLAKWLSDKEIQFQPFGVGIGFMHVKNNPMAYLMPFHLSRSSGETATLDIVNNKWSPVI